MSSNSEYLEEKRPLNQVQYASKDFPSYFDAMLARLKENYADDYNDFSSSSVGVMMLNVMAYGLSQLSFYLDRAASDNYLATARTRDAVTRLASQIGYKVKPAAAATADVQLTFDATSADAIIAKGFLFQGPGDLRFSVTDDVLVSAGATSATVNVKEGSFRETTFTSTGAANQRFDLTGSVANDVYVADTSVRVFVNGLEWSEANFIDFQKSNQFEVSYTSEPPFVQFGDGIAGNIPPVGSTILVRYTLINGSTGNVRSGAITTAVSNFVVGGDNVAFNTVNNANAAAGGADPESIESVKRNAPKVFQSRDVAVTQKDYDALVNSFTDPTYGAVSKGYAAVVRTQAEDPTSILYLDSLKAILVNLVNASTANTLNANTQLDVIQNLLTSVALDTASVSTNLGTASSDIGTSNTSLNTAFNNAAASLGQLTEASLTLAQASSAVAASGATASEVADINATITIANGLINDAKTNLNTFSSVNETVVNDLTSIQSTLDSDETKLQALTLATPASVSAALAIESDLTQIDNNGQSSIGFHETTAQAFSDYISSLFAADCKSNLVKVPILVKGPDGFYTGPSAGLISAVQTYLDGVKEVTQQVSVISGADSLLNAVIVVKVKINTIYVVAEVKANIESGIDSILKDRDFNSSLYLSDLYDIVEPIAGVEYVNISISSPVENLDADGNLIAGELEIVTKGSVTISEV